MKNIYQLFSECQYISQQVYLESCQHALLFVLCGAIAIFLWCDHLISRARKKKTQSKFKKSIRQKRRKRVKLLPYSNELPVGSLCLGNMATSEVEKYFRRFITCEVLCRDPHVRFYPQGTGVVTVDIYGGGSSRTRLRTPDIIAEKNDKKLLIELDPWYTHQDPEVDKNRNIVFNNLGFFIYRIRLGKNSVAISNTDIIIPLDNIGAHNTLPRKYRDKIVADILRFLK